MTNEEKIKNLSTEQLASVLSFLTHHYDTQFGFTFWGSPFHGRDKLDAKESQEDFVKWLKEEAK